MREDLKSALDRAVRSQPSRLAILGISSRRYGHDLRRAGWNESSVIDLGVPLDSKNLRLTILPALARCPLLRELVLHGHALDRDGAAALAGSHFLKNVESLDLWGSGIGGDGTALLAGSRFLENLKSLNLWGNDIGDKGAVELAKSETLKNLVSLDLGSNHIGEAGAAALAGSKILANLTSLHLWGNEIGDDGAAVLARSQALKCLTLLNLSLNGITDIGAAALAESEFVKNLTSLDLGSNDIGKAGVEALARSRHLKNLMSLHLWSNDIREDGATVLAGARFSVNLVSLDLGDNKIGSGGTTALAGSGLLTNITSLSLRRNNICDDGVSAIARSESLRSLTSLDLRSNGIGSDGVAALAGSDVLKNLTTLDLGGNGIGKDGVAALAESECLENLTTLKLATSLIRDGGAATLARSKSLKHLVSLHLPGNRIGNDGAAAFAEALRSDREPWSSVLQELVLDDNPQTLFPQEVVSSNDAARFRAHARQLSRGSQTLREVKVLILGEGCAGKTHVRKRLFEPDRTAPDGRCESGPLYFSKSHLSTHDFDSVTDSLQARLGEGGVEVPVTLRIWDFGGQPELHATHRFFLSDQRALFIIVADVSRPLAESRLRYWLRMVRAECTGPSGPPPIMVLPVQCDATSPRFTHQDVLAELALAKADLAKSFAGAEGANLNIQLAPWGLGWSDDADKEALRAGGEPLRRQRQDQQRALVAELRGIIADMVRSVPAIQAPVPDSYLRLRAAIQKRFASADPAQVKWIEEDDARALEPSLAADRTAWLVAIDIMHSLGDLHRVPPGMDGRTAGRRFFNPAWVKGPVYALIRPPSPMPAFVGREALNRLLPAPRPGARSDSLWQQFPFTEGDREAALDLMLGCELAFRADEETGRERDLFIPDLLPAAAGPASRGTPHAQTSYPFLRPSTFLRLVGRERARLARDERGVKATRESAEFLIRIEGKPVSINVRADLPNARIEFRSDTPAVHAVHRDAAIQILSAVVEAIQPLRAAEDPAHPLSGPIDPSDHAGIVASIRDLFVKGNKLGPALQHAAAHTLDQLEPDTQRRYLSAIQSALRTINTRTGSSLSADDLVRAWRSESPPDPTDT